MVDAVRKRTVTVDGKRVTLFSYDGNTWSSDPHDARDYRKRVQEALDSYMKSTRHLKESS